MALPPERSSSFLLSSRRRAHNIFNNFSHEKYNLHALKKKLSQKLCGEINLIVTEEGRGGRQEEGDDASMNICFIN